MKKKKWPVFLVCFILLLVCTGVFLFRINRFDLVIQLNAPTEVTIPVGGVFEQPDVQISLVGSHFFRNGIRLERPYEVWGRVDASSPGSYHLTYCAEFWMWEARTEQSVRVLDNEPPAITLISNPDNFTIYGETYDEEGYSAWDNAEGDITERVVRQEKDGVVTYSVSDESGNRTTVSRNIYYVDITPPVLTLLGGDTVTVLSGQNYEEPGWTVTDNRDGDLGGQVKVDGFVDKYRAGNYQLTYTVKDRSGNCTELFRTVTVQGKEQQKTVYPDGKVIYLTFDDGPGVYTEQLLRILAAYDAKATFFVVNTDCVDVISSIAAGGHSLGIHSVNHDYREIYAGADAYFHDILTMQDLIYQKTGVMTYLMRFPGGSSNTVSCFNEGIMTYLTRAVEDMGFRYFDWNVDSRDAGGAKNAKEVYENVIGGVQGQRISIVLQHDIKGFSVEAVEKILAWGNANGYRFLALDMSSPTAHHGVNN